jgi:ketosteroid isomerase-like protein
MRATDEKNRGNRAGRTEHMQENIRTVKDVYEAFSRGDVPAIFGHFHPEAEVYQSPRLPWGGEFRGHEELGVFLSKLTGAVESRVETGWFIDDEDGHVVQIGHTRGTVRETGARFEIPETHVWTVEDGKVMRFESYVDTATMRETLGLEPADPSPGQTGLRPGVGLRP